MVDTFSFTLCGVRGSLPLSLPGGSAFGGNTSCVAVRHGDRVAVLDAGSGIVALGKDLIAQKVRSVDILLSHAHYDHVIGLPFFAPLYQPGMQVTLWYAGTPHAPDGDALLSQLIREPFLPIKRTNLLCDLRFEPLPVEGMVDLGAGTTLTTCPVNHPGGAVAMRVSRDNRHLIYAPDFEHDDGVMDARLVRLMQGADIALLDCTYLPEEYPAYAGYGHAHWQKCAQLANRAGVRRMGMFHHNFSRCDAEIAAAERAARSEHPPVFAAREGMVLTPEPG